MWIRLLLELLCLALLEQERQRFVDGTVDGLEPSLPFPDPDENAEFVLGHVDGLRMPDPQLPYYRFPLPARLPVSFVEFCKLDPICIEDTVVTYHRDRVLRHPLYAGGHKVYYELESQ